jgi:hypothetical protein
MEMVLNFVSAIGFSTIDNAAAHKVFPVSQFLAQKSITELEYPPFSLDLASNGFWLFPKINCAFMG